MKTIYTPPPFRKTAATFVIAATIGFGSAWAAVFNDDFSTGSDAWQTGVAWSVLGSGPNAALTVDTAGDEFAWNTVVPLLGSWVIETEFTLQSLYNDGNWTGTAGIALANDQNQLLYLADVIYSQDAYVLPGMGYYDGSWHNTLEGAQWTPGAQSKFKLRLERPAGSDRFNFTVTCDNGLRLEFTSLPIPASTLNQIQRVGLRGFKSRTAFSYANVTTPASPPVQLTIAMYPGVTLEGIPGSTYAIQSAETVDATEWQTLETVTLLSATQMWFDTGALGMPRRFYRAVEQ